jgi:hypothetical protein
MESAFSSPLCDARMKAVRQPLNSMELNQVVREEGAADIELGPQTVVWRFDDAKLLEMLDLMVPMVNSNSPGHQYVDDLKSPVELLVLSHDEYKGPLNYGEFSQLYPASRAAKP